MENAAKFNATPKITDWSRYKKATVNVDKLVARVALPDPWEPVFLTEKAPFMPEWQKGEITPESLSAVHKANKHKITGIGLRTGKLAVVDIDCTDDALTEVIHTVMIETLGAAALYRRGSKGFAALYWNENPIGKLCIPFTKDGVAHKVEILGLGQEMGAYGHVKATKKSPAFDYKWLDGESALELPPYELPGTTGEKLREFLAAVKAPLVAKGCEVGKITGGSIMERGPGANEQCFPDEEDSDAVTEAGRHFLSQRKPAVEGEGGNQHTYVTATHLRDRNISENMCFQLMTEEGGWNDRCEPPWDHEELKGVIKNAYSYAKQPMGNVIDMFRHDPELEDSILPDGFYDMDGPANPDDNTLSPKEALTRELEEITNATGSSNEQGKWVPYTETEILFGDLLKRKKPPVDYIVHELIEKFELCLFQGAGGAGKGRVLAQLCACMSFGLPFIGHQIAKGLEWVFIGNEDDWKEMGRRFDRMLPGLRSLARENDVELDTEGNLRGRFIDRTGLRTSLVRISEDEITVLPGAVLLRRYLKSIPGHKVVILDSAYDFADWVRTAKVSETMVNWYCKVFLKFLEKDTDSTFIPIAHPSQAGEDRKDESGWSVAWRNAIRSRIGFRKKRGTGKGKEQGPIIPGQFTMAVHKLSHGPDGHEIQLYEKDGIFVTGVPEVEPILAYKLSWAFYLYAVEQARKGQPVLPGRNPDKAMCKAIAEVALSDDTDGEPLTIGYVPVKADVKELIKSRAGGKLSAVRHDSRHKAGLYPVEVAEKWARESAKDGKPSTVFNPPLAEIIIPDAGANIEEGDDEAADL